MLKTKDIVFICDDNYCMPTAVCIQSIIDNIVLESASIIVHVCTFGLTPEKVKTLKDLSTDRIKVEVNAFELGQYKERLDSVSQKSHVTPSALIKFEIANYFEKLDSILYMDSDMVTKGDISELLRFDIEDAYVAASYEFWKHIQKISYSLNRKADEILYFNSGVMLLNLKKMRRDGISEKLWNYKLHQAKTTLMDQESLNVILSSTAKRLSIIWNFNPIFLQNSYITEINKVYGTHYSTLSEIESEVKIIHYVGSSDKPWKYSTARMRSYWDKSYCKLFNYNQLQLKQYTIERRPRFTAIKEIVSEHGVTGLICNIIYQIIERIKNA